MSLAKTFSESFQLPYCVLVLQDRHAEEVRKKKLSMSDDTNVSAEGDS
jgi:hypothetical protein